MKRKITLFTHFYDDAIYVANTLNTLYNPDTDALPTTHYEREWLYNDGCIRVECQDCVYYIYHK